MNSTFSTSKKATIKSNHSHIVDFSTSFRLIPILFVLLISWSCIVISQGEPEGADDGDRADTDTNPDDNSNVNSSTGEARPAKPPPGINDECNDVLKCNENITSIECEKVANASACYIDILKTVISCLDEFACLHLKVEHCENEAIVALPIFQEACRRWGLQYAAEDKKILLEDTADYEKIMATRLKNRTNDVDRSARG